VAIPADLPALSPGNQRNFIKTPRFIRVWHVVACHPRVLRFKFEIYKKIKFQIRQFGRDIDVFVDFDKR
jgi:hypothetical protein